MTVDQFMDFYLWRGQAVQHDRVAKHRTRLAKRRCSIGERMPIQDVSKLMQDVKVLALRVGGYPELLELIQAVRK
jgi:hypothetical protein